MSRVAENSHEFKANICVVFVVENTIRIILYVATGILTLSVLKQVVILIPFMLAAVFLGMKSSSVLNEKIIKKIVIILLILSGIVLIINNIPGCVCEKRRYIILRFFKIQNSMAITQRLMAMISG